MTIESINVDISGPTGAGKSHVALIIERALSEEYGETIKIISDDLATERRLMGEDIASWTRPTCSSITISETNKPSNRNYKQKMEFASTNRSPLLNEVMTTLQSGFMSYNVPRSDLVVCDFRLERSLVDLILRLTQGEALDLPNMELWFGTTVRADLLPERRVSITHLKIVPSLFVPFGDMRSIDFQLAFTGELIQAE